MFPGEFADSEFASRGGGRWKRALVAIDLFMIPAERRPLLRSPMGDIEILHYKNYLHGLGGT
jgi:hypothetical protein